MKNIFTAIKLMLKRRPAVIDREIKKPRVSFLLRCRSTGGFNYVGFDLREGKPTNKGLVRCRCCNSSYNARVTKDMQVGDVIRIGRKHHLEITALNFETQLVKKDAR